MKSKVTVYIGLGSNMGDRRDYIDRALDMLANSDGIKLTIVSSVRETEPEGGPPQGAYLNAVAAMQTVLCPQELLDTTQSIEKNLGRIRSERWGPRTIDLDILLYGDEIINRDNLVIPHPRMHERRFVLEPLCEIAPNVRHPVKGKRVLDMVS